MAARTDIQYIRFYTDGSAARKVETHFSAFKTAVKQSAGKHKRRVIRIDPVAIFGITVAVCMLICMAVGIAQVNNAREKTQAMQHYVEQLSAENAALREEYTAGYDLEAVERTALALGMIPREEATQISLEVTLPQQEQTVTLWTKIGIFLAGLLA